MPKRNPKRTDKEWLDLIQECRWLMEGLSIDQPKAIKGIGRKKDF